MEIHEQYEQEHSDFLTLPNNCQRPRGLDLAIGEWVDEGDGPEVDLVTFEWSPEGNSISSP